MFGVKFLLLGPFLKNPPAYFSIGNCTWGTNCRFIHPGVNDKGNYSLITKPDRFSSNGAPPIGPGPHPLMPANTWVQYCISIYSLNLFEDAMTLSCCLRVWGKQAPTGWLLNVSSTDPLF